MPGQVSRKSIPSRSAADYAAFTSIPSGVTHGSAVGAGEAALGSAKAMVVKSGIWVMVSSAKVMP